MEKIIDFIKKRYKILIPLMVVLVLLITVYFLYREYKYDNYRDKREVLVYQYFGGNRVDYTALVTYNLKGAIVNLEAKDQSISYDGTPVYYRDSSMVLFPEEMNIVFPLKDGAQYRLYKYSLYENDNGEKRITVNTDIGNYNYFFLYDGEGNYFFPDDVVLKIGANKEINLSANSYVYADLYTLIYYDYQKDEAQVLELSKEEIWVENADFSVNVRENYFMHFGKKVLLFKPYKIDSVIDKYR